MTCAATTPDAPLGQPEAGQPRPDTTAPSARFWPARPITTGQSPAGSQNTTPDLTARAVRVSNRNKAAAQRYLRLHQILANKLSSDPENGQ